MRLLLDSHAFLWWIEDDERLSEHAREAITYSEDIFLSTASSWEITIKVHLGKLDIGGDPQEVIPRELRKNNIDALPVKLAHSLGVFGLPDHHGDPFDRLLVAQAQAEKLVLVSTDPVISKYDVEMLW